MLKYSKYIIRKSNTLPIYLILEVTSLCNSKCLTCFNWKKTDYDKEKKLSLHDLEKISQGMKGLLWLALTGGEVFMREDVPDIVRLFEKNNDVKNVTVATNCLLPDNIKRLSEDILQTTKCNFIVGLSIDGIGPLH